VPGSHDEYYGLTDRGPNVDGPDGEKVLPLPGFVPAIGRFRLAGNRAVLERTIPLREADGTPYSGRVNPQAATGENLVDLNGTPLAPDGSGYDSEGLVAMPDGSFWVSDEYGPFITHFDRHGRATRRLSPFDGSLPAELAHRVPNKGMEGLTVTPDGRTLVGIMQSALQQPDVTAKPANITTLRIVTYDLRTRATHEYIYLLDDPKTNSGAVSEITALSPTTARQGRGRRGQRPHDRGEQRQRLRRRRGHERRPSVHAARQDPPGRPSGRRRVPRHRHDPPAGGHEHRDGDHHGPLTVSPPGEYSRRVSGPGSPGGGPVRRPGRR
jgi:hypothetical protein